MHGFFHARQALLPGTGQDRSLIGSRGHFGHGAHQITGRGGDFPGRSADLCGGGCGFSGGSLLLLGGGGNFRNRGGDLHRRALSLGNQRRQLGHHVVEAGFHGAKLVLAFQVQARAQVTGTHHFQNRYDALHRRHDCPQQQKAAKRSGKYGNHQRNDHADLRGNDGLGNRVTCLGCRLTVGIDQEVELFTPGHPGRGQLLADQTLGLVELLAFVQRNHLGQVFGVLLVQHLEFIEIGAVITVENSPAVVLQLLIKTVLIAGVKFAVFVGQVTAIVCADQLQGQDITVHPGTANHRTVIDPGNRIGAHCFFAAFNRQQARVRRNNHQQHNGDDYSKARQDALA